MSGFIRDARRVVDRIALQFHGSDDSTVVDRNPDKIVEIYGAMALWAQTTSSNAVVVRMRMPALKRALERLADQGPGNTTVVNGVRWRFVPRKFLSSSTDKSLLTVDPETRTSGTTTPISTLS
jgi:hypothetical protein